MFWVRFYDFLVVHHKRGKNVMSRKKKREFRGIQVNAGADTVYIFGKDMSDLMVDCHLGSIILTKDEILDYLEQRGPAGWRDVQEELPQRDGIVLVYCPSQDPKKGLTALAWYNPEKGWSHLPDVWIEVITHWQQIPSPPKKRSEAKPKAEA